MLIYALIGFVVMFAILIVIGINNPRGTTVKGWCYMYLVIALIFDGLVIFSLFYHHVELTQLLLGVSAGSATGLAIHVAHHIVEENEEP